VEPVLYSFLGMLGAAVLIGLGYIIYKFVSTVNALRTSVNQAAESVRIASQAMEKIAPLLKSEELVRMMNAFILMGRQGSEMLLKMGELNKTIGLFYKFAVSREGIAAEARGPAEPATAGSRFVPYNEERAAAAEAAANVNQAPEEV